jgi:hypothetical protein
MDVPAPRRLLYGKLIHLFRIWVTSADNLLDGEDKEVVPVLMPGNARVMRQVVAVMAADRVLAEILNDAVAAGAITAAQRDELARESLRRLLPAPRRKPPMKAHRRPPPPGGKPRVIHRLKTGLLFNVAFVGPEIVEPLAGGPHRAACAPACGLRPRCQCSTTCATCARSPRKAAQLRALRAGPRTPERAGRTGRPRALRFPTGSISKTRNFALPAARRGFDLLVSACARSAKPCLGYDGAQAESMARALFPELDLRGLTKI